MVTVVSINVGIDRYEATQAYVAPQQMTARATRCFVVVCC